MKRFFFSYFLLLSPCLTSRSPSLKLYLSLPTSTPLPPPFSTPHFPFFAPYPLFPLFAFITDDLPAKAPSELLTTLRFPAAVASRPTSSRGGLPLHTTRSAVPANPAAARSDRSTYLR